MQAPPVVSGVPQSTTAQPNVAVAPFAGTMITDDNPGDTIGAYITQGMLQGGSLTGDGLTAVPNEPNGHYLLTGTASQVTYMLDNLKFLEPDPASVGLYGTSGSTTTNVEFNLTVQDETTGVGVAAATMVEDTNLPPAPVPPAHNFLVVNTTAGPAGFEQGQQYQGPVAGLKWELIAFSASKPGDPSLNVTSYVPDAWIKTGTGNDAINVSQANGNNILDGGGGSNFLTGGSGDDTFYVDGRGQTSNTWSTIKGFHSGDGVTVWGMTPQDFQLTWLDNQGAAGSTGLTAVFTNGSQPEVGLTIAGYSAADLSDGKLSISYGRTQDLPGLPGSYYFHIQAT